MNVCELCVYTSVSVRVLVSVHGVKMGVCTQVYLCESVRGGHGMCVSVYECAGTYMYLCEEGVICVKMCVSVSECVRGSVENTQGSRQDLVKVPAWCPLPYR